MKGKEGKHGFKADQKRDTGNRLRHRQWSSGSGGGTILVPFMQKSLHVEQHKSHATTVAVVAPLCIVSAFFYIGHQAVDWWVLLAVSAGGIVGGIAGAKLLQRISGRWLHWIFGGLMLASAVRMLL